MTIATTADLEERDTRRLERYRRVTYRSFMLAAVGFVAPVPLGLASARSEGDADIPVIVAAVAGLGLLTWYYSRLVRAGLEGGASRRDMVGSGAVTAALSLLLLISPWFTVVPVFWLSAVVLSPLPRKRLVALCAGTGAYCAVIATIGAGRLGTSGTLPWYEVFPLLFAVFSGVCGVVAFVNLYQRRMWDMHRETHAARDALARLAVTEERLRFSRDLHDLLGHSLSLIAVKSELALRMASADPGRAGAEMADVQRAAREALREVRAAVSGYRAVELDTELAGVRAVLEAAGVRCEIDDPPGTLPPEVRSVLAWVIREAATNVIKHSEARHCAITLAVYGGSVVLEMRNDGVRGDAGSEGSGLTGLAERAAVLGGEVTAGRHGRDGFLLRAAVPLPAPADDTAPEPPATTPATTPAGTSAGTSAGASAEAAGTAARATTGGDA